eukprot:TRINITY_DN2653_c0_g5_i2.p1 TRINITY_DN2653_c0_g5~~TRINITY_DN2653_c0_g5_i2.p1  ORF type:complete len:308 (+),score=57.81 TRINITY_DN2653_c0_g5_i2:96-1019(+)
MKNYQISPELKEIYEMNMLKTQSDDLEEVLYDLDIVLLIDRSGSMQFVDEDPLGVGKRGICGPYWSRYDNVIKFLKMTLDDMSHFDKDDNVPCYFFDSEIIKFELQQPMEVVLKAKMNKPRNSTNMLGALQQAFDDTDLSNGNTLFICLTDGAPDDGQEPLILDLIKRNLVAADPTGDRLNVLFVRFGDDPGAIQFLQYLDDCDEVGEWVDTKSDNAAYKMGPKLLILNGIYEHLEKDPEWIPIFEDSHPSKARAITNYTAQQNNEHSFSTGDIVTILGKQHQGWWIVLMNGRQAFVPGQCFVEIES